MYEGVGLVVDMTIFDEEIDGRKCRGGRKVHTGESMNERCRVCGKRLDEFETTTLETGYKICNDCYNRTNTTSRLFYGKM
jgi:hypothetical protein